jgi:hypothetical protein
MEGIRQKWSDHIWTMEDDTNIRVKTKGEMSYRRAFKETDGPVINI